MAADAVADLRGCMQCTDWDVYFAGLVLCV